MLLHYQPPFLGRPSIGKRLGDPFCLTEDSLGLWWDGAGYTPAAGADHEGCGCHTFEFGCCPDQLTVARGANLEGCGCENTAHGCCPDGRTPADGPHYDGCGCQVRFYPRL